jgi:hypothetical protein
MARLTNKQIAEHFGFTASRAAALVAQGMPVTSLEEAEAWRQARLLRGIRGGIEVRSAPTVDPGLINPDDSFEQTVERHRELKEAARQTYIVARDAGDPSAPKHYTTYQNILKTLVTIEREALARRIEAKELIKTQTAVDKFGRVMGEVKGDLLGLPVQIASQCNPNNPGLALKVIDAKLNELMAKWARSASMVQEEVVEPVKIQAPSLDDMGGDVDGG